MYRKISRFLIVVGIGTLGVFGFSSLKETTEAQSNRNSTDKRPNVIMVISDDMGYTDMGAFGGEIPTPNLDNLAEQGMMLTNFHTGATCSPSRSMILTGVDNHRAGLGTMLGRLTDNQRGKPGYEGIINDRVVTIPTLLKDGGYHTYMTGKWHLGEEPEKTPTGQGFEQVFGILQGGADHYAKTTFGPGDEATYFSNGQIIEAPDNFYSTKNYTDKMIEFIEQNRKTGKPFYGYLAYTAPHEPLQVPQEYIDKYISTYSVGWDKIREQRFERMQKLGIIPDYLELPPRWQMVPAWNSLNPEEQRYEAKKMAIYAGMIDYMDEEVGKLISYLKQIGEYENTIIIYFSDNGATPNEFSELEAWKEWLQQIGYDNSYENIGNPNSFVGVGPGWAQASITAFSGAKGSMGEGGIRGHFAVTYPGKIVPASRTDAFASVKDLVPTILDYAGVPNPGSNYKGRPIHPIEGKSMRPLWEGHSNSIYSDKEPIAFELYGNTNKTLFMGDWKILKLGDKPWGNGPSEPWKLYNLRIDPTETKDLSQMYPEKLKEMIELYEKQEKDWGFVPAQ